jgi:PBP superfamily domain
VVTGPRLWDPAAHKKFAHPSYVAVSLVQDLTNQVVSVSWRNFTPSSQVTYIATGTNYPVMVAECKGTHPTKQSQCFGADNGGIQGSVGQFGPQNTQYSTTARNGTGEAFIQLLTAEEAPQLGCNLGHECSLVIEPAQGGNIFTGNCADHSQDSGQTAIGSVAFTTFGTCSWRDRIIVPLTFEPTPTDCPVHNPNFSVIGSPMLARAMGSWQTALCSAADPEFIQYDSAQNEPLARQDFVAGTDTVALTTLPLTGAKGPRPFTYAPVAISAESVAFWIDNPRTGKPLTHLKLDPRLVLKLLTQSYNFENEACGHGSANTSGVGCDNAVDNDPSSLFADPEFMRLNPHVADVGDGFQVPTVLSGQSDMTWELTSWIAASKPAKAFADGAFDPWGAHVNTDYLNMTLPTNTLSPMDPYPPIAHRYDPFFPLSSVAQYQVNNWYPATAWQPDTTGNFDALQPEIPGNRALFAIIDQGDAAAYELPVASLENAAGKYVAPTSASMTAALGAMKTAKNHITQQVNFGTGPRKWRRKSPDAYPLTMVIYAMVPTGGLPKAKAAKIAQWLDFVANQGQQSGYGPGQLPPGYLPLTAAMRARTLKAANEVLKQTGDRKKAATATASPAPSPTHTVTGTVSLGFDRNPLAAGALRYIVPILLIAGALLAVASSFSLAVGRGSRALVGRLGQLRQLKLPEFNLPGRKKS